MLTRRWLLRHGAALPAAGLASTLATGAGAAGQLGRSVPEYGGFLDAAGSLSPGSAEDQSAGFLEALRRASGLGRPLFLPPGRYVVAEIDMPERSHIVGVPGESRIVFGGGRYLLSAAGGHRLRLEGLTIDGRGIAPDKGAGGLVAARDVADVVVRDCDVMMSGRSGIRLEACAGRISETRVSDCRAIGVHLVGSRGMAVVDNSISAIGNTGILVQRRDKGADDTIVRGNRVAGVSARSGGTGQFGNGINVAQADGVIVSDNRIDDCAFSAVRAYSSSNVRIAGNIATRSGEVALYVEFAFEGANVSDNIVDDAGVGISLANFLTYGGRLSVCSNNLIRNLRPTATEPTGRGRYGVGISAEADTALTGNVIENAPLCGFQLGWGPHLRDVAATGNVVRDTSIGFAVSVVDGARATLIADNLISGARLGAVLGMHWAEPVTGELAREDAKTFPHLSVVRNRVG